MCEKAAKEMAIKDISGKSFMVSPVFSTFPLIEVTHKYTFRDEGGFEHVFYQKVKNLILRNNKSVYKWPILRRLMGVSGISV